LTNQIQSTNLNRRQLQNIDTPVEFEQALSIPDDKPASVDQVNGAVRLNPVTYYTEAENADSRQGSIFQSASTLSNDFGVNVDGFQDFVEFTFTLNQDIPAGKLRVGTYAELDNWDGTIEYSFDGNVYREVFRDSVSGQNLVEGFSGTLTVNNSKLEAGTTHTLRAKNTGVVAGNHIIDAMFAYDDRFNIQTPASSAFNGNTYDFPELFPKEASVSFAEVSSRRKLTELELFQDWNDTSNNTSVTLNLGSQSKTINNPTRNTSGRIRETLSVSSSNASRTGSIDITLSRFNDTSTSSTIPRLGDGGQRMSFHIVDGNPNAVTRSNIGEATTRAFFESGFLTGNTLKEAGQKAGGDLLTHSIFADVDPDNDNIIGSEQIKFIPK